MLEYAIFLSVCSTDFSFHSLSLLFQSLPVVKIKFLMFVY